MCGRKPELLCNALFAMTQSSECTRLFFDLIGTIWKYFYAPKSLTKTQSDGSWLCLHCNTHEEGYSSSPQMSSAGSLKQIFFKITETTWGKKKRNIEDDTDSLTEMIRKPDWSNKSESNWGTCCHKMFQWLTFTVLSEYLQICPWFSHD